MIATEPNAATSSGVFAVGGADFEARVLQSDLPVLVDFWAAWCGPCRALKPTFEKMSQEFAGQMHFATLDIEAHPELAAHLGVQGVPTLLFFDRGQIVDHILGFNPTRLRESVGKVIAGHNAA